MVLFIHEICEKVLALIPQTLIRYNICIIADFFTSLSLYVLVHLSGFFIVKTRIYRSSIKIYIFPVFVASLLMPLHFLTMEPLGTIDVSHFCCCCLFFWFQFVIFLFILPISFFRCYQQQLIRGGNTLLFVLLYFR